MNPVSGTAVPKTWWSPMASYLTPRMLIILAMGFASGLPLLLTLSTLSYWLSKVGVDKTTIGLFALVGTPYTFKFLWSPIMDQLRLPILDRLLGRRRGWLLLTQLLLSVAIFFMGLTDPAINPTGTAVMALIIAFLSASQDIVIDAYRIEILARGPAGARRRRDPDRLSLRPASRRCRRAGAVGLFFLALRLHRAGRGHGGIDHHHSACA